MLAPHHGRHFVVRNGTGNSMSPLHWARLKTEAPYPLRRGAWYRVTTFGAESVAVDVNRTPLLVPRSVVDVVATPPERWTVVPRPAGAGRLPASWGELYAVCPNCRDRALLRGDVESMRCPRCNSLFAVAWDEGYLGRRAHGPAPQSPDERGREGGLRPTRRPLQAPAASDLLRERVGAGLRQAREEAHAAQSELLRDWHPQAGQAASLYLALSALQMRLLLVDSPSPSRSEVVADLEGLIGECQGVLTRVKPAIEAVLRVAQEAE
jgi:hypothetical protein